jgi:hypothetical protein
MLIISSIVLALLLCSLLISVYITQFYLRTKRENEPSFDPYEDQEAREAGELITISTKHASNGLHVFFWTFLICVIGTSVLLGSFYKLSLAVMFMVNMKKSIVIALCILITYIASTTYFNKTDVKEAEKNDVWSIWSLFRIKFTAVNKKGKMYLDDALAFYKTLGYFWMLLTLLIFIV